MFWLTGGVGVGWGGRVCVVGCWGWGSGGGVVDGGVLICDRCVDSMGGGAVGIIGI